MQKHSALICAGILILALAIRLIAAQVAVLEEDVEVDQIEFIHQVMDKPGAPHIIVGDVKLENPLLSTYILKAGTSIFGESRLGIRFPFVLLSVIGLLFAYLLVREKVNAAAATVCLCLLTLSQFHIGESRIAGEHALVLFFVITAMYLFFRALDTQKARYIYGLGITVGLGCLDYEWVVLLVPVFLFYLAVEKKYSFWLKRKELYGAGLIILAIVMPFLVWSYHNGFSKLGKEHIFDLGFSLRSVYLYFGEVFAWLTDHTKFFIFGDPVHDGGSLVKIGGHWFLRVDGSNEKPFIHWVMGVLIFAGYIRSLTMKKRDDLTTFCVVMFTVVFLATSIVAGSYSIFDDHWWAGMTIYPGIILSAMMLDEFQRKYFIGKIATIAMIAYLGFHAIQFVQLPEHQYAVPELYLQQWYLDKADFYLKKGEKELAAQRCQWVLNRTHDPDIREVAHRLFNGIRNSR